MKFQRGQWNSDMLAGVLELFSRVLCACRLGRLSVPPAGLVLPPTQSLSLAVHVYIGCKVDLFIFFLSGYLKSKTMVAVEICGRSDALFPWGMGYSGGTGLSGRYLLARGARCKPG